MNRPLLSRLTSCGTPSYARGVQYGISVRTSLPLASPGIEQAGEKLRIVVLENYWLFRIVVCSCLVANSDDAASELSRVSAQSSH
jgi:hypothetical protein